LITSAEGIQIGRGTPPGGGTRIRAPHGHFALRPAACAFMENGRPQAGQAKWTWSGVLSFVTSSFCGFAGGR